MSTKTKTVFLCLFIFMVSLSLIVSRAMIKTTGISFEKTYGGNGNDRGKYVQMTSDQGYIIVGITNSFGAENDNVYLIKTNSFGDTLWTKTYGGSGYDLGFTVRETADGGFIIGGRTASYPLYNDALFIRTDSLGDTLWTKRYHYLSYNGCFALDFTDDGGFIATGETFNGDFRIYLIRMNADGDTLWTKALGNGANGYNGGRDVHQTSDGGFVIVGETSLSSTGTVDVYLVKTNSQGDTLWTKTYGGTDYDYGVSVQQTLDGGYIIGAGSIGSSSNYIYVVKTDSSGNPIWTKTYEGYSIGSIEQTSDGGYVIGGSNAQQGINNMPDFYLIKTDSSGNILLERLYGFNGWDECSYVQQTPDSGFIMIGYTSANYGSGPYDVYFVKTNAEGEVTWINNPKQDNEQMIQSFYLQQNYPNPFNPTTKINYMISSTEHIELKIFDLLGNEVATLVDGVKSAGTYSVVFNAENLPSGVYFYQLQVGKLRQTHKMLLCR